MRRSRKLTLYNYVLTFIPLNASRHAINNLKSSYVSNVLAENFCLLFFFSEVNNHEVKKTKLVSSLFCIPFDIVF